MVRGLDLLVASLVKVMGTRPKQIQFTPATTTLLPFTLNSESLEAAESYSMAPSMHLQHLLLPAEHYPHIVSEFYHSRCLWRLGPSTAQWL